MRANSHGGRGESVAWLQRDRVGSGSERGKRAAHDQIGGTRAMKKNKVDFRKQAGCALKRAKRGARKAKDAPLGSGGNKPQRGAGEAREARWGCKRA